MLEIQGKTRARIQGLDTYRAQTPVGIIVCLSIHLLRTPSPSSLPPSSFLSLSLNFKSFLSSLSLHRKCSPIQLYTKRLNEVLDVIA